MNVRHPEWFITNPAAAPDVLRSADLARENSGLEQFIHHHAEGDPCNWECGVRLPLWGGTLL